MEMRFDKKELDEQIKEILKERVRHKKFIARYYKSKGIKPWTEEGEESLLKERFSFLFSKKELEPDHKLSRKERLKFIDSWVDFVQKNPNKVWSRLQADFIDTFYGKYKE